MTFIHTQLEDLVSEQRGTISGLVGFIILQVTLTTPAERYTSKNIFRSLWRFPQLAHPACQELYFTAWIWSGPDPNHYRYPIVDGVIEEGAGQWQGHLTGSVVGQGEDGALEYRTEQLKDLPIGSQSCQVM